MKPLLATILALATPLSAQHIGTHYGRSCPDPVSPYISAGIDSSRPEPRLVIGVQPSYASSWRMGIYMLFVVISLRPDNVRLPTGCSLLVDPAYCTTVVFWPTDVGRGNNVAWPLPTVPTHIFVQGAAVAWPGPYYTDAIEIRLLKAPVQD